MATNLRQEFRRKTETNIAAKAAARIEARTAAEKSPRDKGGVICGEVILARIEAKTVSKLKAASGETKKRSTPSQIRRTDDQNETQQREVGATGGGGFYWQLCFNKITLLQRRKTMYREGEQAALSGSVRVVRT